MSEIIAIISMLAAGANGIGMLLMYVRYIRLAQASREFAIELIGSIAWTEDGEPSFSDPVTLATGGIRFLSELKDHVKP